MGYFSEIWNGLCDGVKSIANGVGEIIGTIVEVLFDGIFWLVEKIFDAITSFFEFIEETIDWIIAEVGSFFTSKDKDGEGGILPPTPEVTGLIEKYDKEFGTAYHRKAKEGKGSLSYIEDGNGKVVGARIVGSDKGFASEITECHKRRRIFASKIKNE